MALRLVVNLLVFALAVVGCAGTAAPSSPPPSPSPAPSVAPSPSPAPPSEAACVDVTHALGTSCIPADPQRVVTLGFQTSLEYALALGLPVVGYDGQAIEPHAPAYIPAELVAGATFVGEGGAPDLEQVKALEPDLIIYTYDNGDYPQVSAIAPTVVLSAGYASYRDDFLGAAKLLGKTDKANQVLADLDGRITALAGQLAPKLGGKTVSAFRTGTDGKANILGEQTYVGELLKDLGIERPADQAGAFINVSLEQIAMLDGDVGFVVHGYFNNDPSDDAAIEATRKQYVENPLWSTLTFVKNDEIYILDPLLYGSHGIIWADAVLENMAQVVLG